jgi:hypothetical protein
VGGLRRSRRRLRFSNALLGEYSLLPRTGTLTCALPGLLVAQGDLVGLGDVVGLDGSQSLA